MPTGPCGPCCSNEPVGMMTVARSPRSARSGARSPASSCGPWIRSQVSSRSLVGQLNIENLRKLISWSPIVVASGHNAHLRLAHRRGKMRATFPEPLAGAALAAAFDAPRLRWCGHRSHQPTPVGDTADGAQPIATGASTDAPRACSRQRRPRPAPRRKPTSLRQPRHGHAEPGDTRRRCQTPSTVAEQHPQPGTTSHRPLQRRKGPTPLSPSPNRRIDFGTSRPRTDKSVHPSLLT